MISRLEDFDLVQSILPGLFSRTAGGQDQTGPIVGPTQLRGHQQDAVAQGLKGGVLKLWGQAEPLEPVHQVVGQQEEMEVGLVGEEVAGRDAVQGVIAFELLDEQLDPGAVVVEAPEVERLPTVASPVLRAVRPLTLLPNRIE